MKKLIPRFKLWLNAENAQAAFGDGKWRLLKAIESTGSLQAACNKLHISYRKAWGDLKKAEQALNVNLVVKQRGGNTGGRTGLTEQGKKWLAAYEKFHSEIQEAVKKSRKKHIDVLLK